MTGAAGARWVVRLGKQRGAGIYYRQPRFPGIYEWRAFTQRDAHRMTRVEAEDMKRAAAKPTNGGDPLHWRVVRLVSRAEAVERMRLRTLEEARQIVSAAPNQQAAWDEIGKLMEMGR